MKNEIINGIDIVRKQYYTNNIKLIRM